MKGLTFTLMFIFLVVCFISCGGSTGKDLRVVSAKMLPYKPEERGKFVEFCFNRKIGLHEKYVVDITLKPKATGQVSYTYVVNVIGPYDNAGPCFKVNVYLIIGRHTDVQTRNIVEEHIRIGNMEYIDIKVHKESSRAYEVKGKLLTQAHFSNFTD